MSDDVLRPAKAYKNPEFLNSTDARLIRVMCEFEETKQRLSDEGVKNTIVMFGSARMVSNEDAKAQLAAAEAADKHAATDATEEALQKANSALLRSRYYEEARELSRRLTQWNNDRAASEIKYIVTSGGGPGIMEAANRGAYDAGGRSVGLGISLPFEPGVNKYTTPELAFEFHYFFTRKYWFLYLCEGLIIFPGGFGTMDELFETLTLIQTQKITKKLPIVLYGTDYWDQVINIDAMVEFGTISAKDLDLIHRSNSVDDAFDYLTRELL